jgi:hypothetical protein
VRGLVLQHGARRSTLSTIEGRCAAVLFLLDPDPPSVARLPERSRVSPPHYRRRKAANRSRTGGPWMSGPSRRHHPQGACGWRRLRMGGGQPPKRSLPLPDQPYD